MTADRETLLALAERYKVIPGFEPYAVSEHGVVLAKNGRAMKVSRKGTTGYLGVSIRVKGKNVTLTIHRAVAFAWVGPKPGEEFVVAHLDGDMDNNSAINLIWCERSENEKHKLAHGTALIGAKNPQTRLTEDEVRELRALYLRGDSTRTLARRFGISHQVSWQIAVGKARKHVRAMAEGRA